MPNEGFWQLIKITINWLLGFIKRWNLNKKRGIYKGEKIVDALKYILIRGINEIGLFELILMIYILRILDFSYMELYGMSALKVPKWVLSAQKVPKKKGM